MTTALSHALPTWRSQLTFPVNVAKFVAKAQSRGADCIVLDLEDAVAPGQKAEARACLDEAIAICTGGPSDILVRINNPIEEAVRDVEAAISPAVAGLVLSKVEDAGYVRALADLVSRLELERGLVEGSTRFMIAVETASAFPRLFEIAAAHPRNVALCLGLEDFATSIGAQPDSEVLQYPLQQMIIAARSQGLLPMGLLGAAVDYRNLDGLRDAAIRSRRFGLAGCPCIHPDMVPALNEGFTPSAEEARQARRVLEAFAQARLDHRGAFSLDGKMVDAPIVTRAEHTLSMFERTAQQHAEEA
jgi:citrate lyase subunit beta/citryl-CoA lyase